MTERITTTCAEPGFDNTMCKFDCVALAKLYPDISELALAEGLPWHEEFRRIWGGIRDGTLKHTNKALYDKFTSYCLNQPRRKI